MSTTFGVQGAAVNGTGNLSPAYPAITEGQGIYCAIHYANDTGDEYTMPSGWTRVAGSYGGNGTYGAGTGPRGVVVYKRDADGTGSETGTVTVTATASTTGRIAYAYMFTMNKTLDIWRHDAVNNSDTTTGSTTYSVSGTLPDEHGIVNGTTAVVVTSWLPSTVTQSTPNLTISGTGSAGLTGRNAAGTATGNDIRYILQSRAITGEPTDSNWSHSQIASANTVHGTTAVLFITDESAPTVKEGTETTGLGVTENIVITIAVERSDFAELSVSENVAVEGDSALANEVVSFTDSAGLTDTGAIDGLGASTTDNSGTTDNFTFAKTVIVTEPVSYNDNSGTTDFGETRIVSGWADNISDNSGLTDNIVVNRTTLTNNPTASEIRSLSVTEATNLRIVVTRTDNVAITVNDNASTVRSITAFDNSAIEVSESRTIARPVTSSDTLSISASESGTLPGITPISGSDSTEISLSETSVIFKAFTSTDNIALALSDVANGFRAVSRTDTAAISVTDAGTKVAPSGNKVFKAYIDGEWVRGVAKVYVNGVWTIKPVKKYTNGVWT